MSVQAMAWAIDHSQHKGGSLLVLLMIANHAKSDGSGAWPSTATIARETRMSERQVRRIIDNVLEPSRELSVTRREGRPHLYDMPQVRGENPGQDDHGAVDKMSDPPRTLLAVTPDIAMSDEPKATIKQPPTPPTGVAARSRDPIWEALEACFGPAPKSPTYRGAWGTAAKELREQGATPEQIAERVVLYKCSMPDAACTPTALAKHWGRLASAAARPVSKFERANARRRMRDGADGGEEHRAVGGSGLGLGDAR